MPQEPLPPGLLKRAIEVFGREDKARRWLTRAHPSLDGVSPVEALEAPNGKQQVEQLLQRIEYGLYD